MTITAPKHNLRLFSILIFLHFQGTLSTQAVRKLHPMHMQSFSWYVWLHSLLYGSNTENWKFEKVLILEWKNGSWTEVIKIKCIFQPKSLNRKAPNIRVTEKSKNQNQTKFEWIDSSHNNNSWLVSCFAWF